MARKILLVEDSPDDVELTLIAMRDSNIANDVVVASDGQQAVDLLLGPEPSLPAVVLLDLNLPKIDGLEVLRRVRDNPATRNLPVVVMTSSKREEDLTRSYGLGANAYVRKPVGFEEFVEATRVLGLFWLVFNESPPTNDDTASP